MGAKHASTAPRVRIAHPRGGRGVPRRGRDPHAAGRRTGRAPAFADALETVIATRQPGWKSGAQRAGRWRASLRRHAFPHIGRKRVDAITTADVMTVLTPIWTTTPRMARNVRQRIAADRDLLLPANLTKRLGDHSRLQDVTEDYPADWTMEQRRDAAQHIADKIDEFIRAGVPAPADRAA